MILYWSRLGFKTSVPAKGIVITHDETSPILQWLCRRYISQQFSWSNCVIIFLTEWSNLNSSGLARPLRIWWCVNTIPIPGGAYLTEMSLRLCFPNPYLKYPGSIAIILCVQPHRGHLRRCLNFVPLISNLVSNPIPMVFKKDVINRYVWPNLAA